MFNKNINKLIEISYAFKPLRQELRAFHVAGIFYKSRLVSLGTNTRKTHPFTVKNGYPYTALHAECAAIIRGRLEDYSGHDLIVLRINNENKIANSKPCKYCQNLINKLNFKSVVYSDDSGKFTY